MANEAEKKNWAPPIPKEILQQEAAADAVIKGEAAPGDKPITTDLEKEGKPTDLVGESAQKPPKEEDEGNWETKYRVLQGKYDSEIRSLTQGNRDMTTKVEALQETIANLNNLLIQMRTEKPAARAPAESFEHAAAEDGDLTERDFEGYGPEMPKFYRRFTALEAENAALKAKLGTVDRMEKVVTRTEEEAKRQEGLSWETRMNSICPWTEVNNAPEFLTWLQADGGFMLNLAQGYADQRQAEKLHGVVKRFIKETGWTKAEPAEGIESQVVPEGAGDGVPRQTKKQGRVTEADYNQALKDFTQKRITEAAFDKIIMGRQRTIQEERAGRR
jgi:predicted RNase H-like nuclease (RuvC/YqgF family)